VHKFIHYIFSGGVIHSFYSMTTMGANQSCQQATFFQPDLACGLAWSNWSCLACQAKNQGAACA
jgi:hypothetical protein